MLKYVKTVLTSPPLYTLEKEAEKDKEEKEEEDNNPLYTLYSTPQGTEGTDVCRSLVVEAGDGLIVKF